MAHKTMPKVSIVIPCYNKQHSVGDTFDSILRQTWDNIEVVIVNDGSTDNTTDIIENSLPKFHARGYECILYNQDNRGLASAVHEGLKRITGDFVCQVDADDTLEPEYVSVMANWLVEYPDYEWVGCSKNVVKDGIKINELPLFRGVFETYENMLELFLLWRISSSVARFLIRVTYLKTCKIVENFYTEARIWQEPQILLPLLAYNGKLKYFNFPLYNYVKHQSEKHMSFANFADFGTCKSSLDKMVIMVRETINTLSISECKKKRLFHLIPFFRITRYIVFARDFASEIVKNLKKEYIDLVNSCFLPEPQIGYDAVDYFEFLVNWVEGNILGTLTKKLEPKARVIVWGVMGFNGRKLLSRLTGTELQPTELWDKAGDGTLIKKPDVASLSSDDIVIATPYMRFDTLDMFAELEKSPCIKLTYGDACGILASYMFPQLYEEKFCFNVNKEVEV